MNFAFLRLILRGKRVRIMKRYLLVLMLSIFTVSAFAFPLKGDSERNAEIIRTGAYKTGVPLPNTDTSWKVQVEGKELKCDYSNIGSNEIICK